MSEKKTEMIDGILEDATTKMFHPSIVAELCKDGVTDYERGLVAGQIQMLNWIKAKLAPKVKTESVIDEDTKIRHKS